MNVTVLSVLCVYSQKAYKIPLEAELDAIKNVCVKLMELPVGDLLPALKEVTVFECFVYNILLYDEDNQKK